MFRSIRGQILGFLYKVYPEGVEEIGIISVFYEYHKESYIRKSLQYLVDKGYIEARRLPHPLNKRKDLTIYKILPKGVDLVEGNIRDNTIFIEEEE